jgi:hypothetical protein
MPVRRVPVGPAAQPPIELPLQLPLQKSAQLPDPQLVRDLVVRAAGEPARR